MDLDATPRVSSPRPKRRASLRVVLVDSDESQCRALTRALRDAGHEPEVFHDNGVALAALVGERPATVDAVVCTLGDGGAASPSAVRGEELCAALQLRFGLMAPPVILIAPPGTDRAALGGKLGAWHVLATPVRAADLVDAVERATRLPIGAEPRQRPDRLGPWIVTGEVGRGGMGVVYSARRGTEEAALKVFACMDDGDDPEGLFRFRRELDVLTSLDHPGVPRFLDQGVDRGALYYVMELAPGRPLAHLLADDGPLPWRRVAELGRDLAGTLAYLHAKKIVHRDVKPQNLVIHPGRHPKLIDFGLARRPHDPSLTAVNTVLGTPLYLAPETIDEGRASDASDVFSLGMSLFEALVGHHPLAPKEDPKPRAIHTLYAHGLVPKVRSLVPDAPESVAHALEWSLAPDPLERPSAAQLQDLLDKALTQRDA